MKAHLTKVSLALLSAVFFFGCQEQGSGPVGLEGLGILLDKTETKHSHGGGGGDKTQDCQIRFDLTLGTLTDPVVRSDNGELYKDGLDRVSVHTGSGDGFRFDTNGGSQKLEKNNDIRRVTLDFTGTGPEHDTNFKSLMKKVDGVPIPKGIDLRFTKDKGGLKLDLCALDVYESGTVSVALTFLDLEGSVWTLRYGGVRLGIDCGAEVRVTRTNDDTWQLASGPTACLNKGYPGQPEETACLPGQPKEPTCVVDMPIAFTIVAQS